MTALDGGAWLHEAYEAHFAFVLHLLRRLGVREADLHDAAHDVFVVLHRRRDAYDPSRPLRAWLAGIATRVASDHRSRAHHARESYEPPPERAAEGPGPEGELHRAEARRLLAAALEALDEKQRTVVVLHDLEGLEVKEIALVVEAPLNTLYSRLRLGREKLAAEVARLRGGAAGKEGAA